MRLTLVLLMVCCTVTSVGAANALVVPEMVDAQPAAGRRVKHQLDTYRDSKVYHALYLPTDWRAPSKENEARYPVIVEYAGNRYGPDRNGDICTGTPEGCKLGYGVSGERGIIWICLPYVNAKERRNQLTWWGDVGATVDYCKRAVRMVCDEFGGDPKRVVLTGFSRGAIACGYIGLHDREIAKLWCAFIPHSHFDGVRNWGYAGAVGEPARKRLLRGADRPWFVTHERSVDATRKYVTKSLSAEQLAHFTFTALPSPRHTDTWVLSENPQRKALRTWLTGVLRDAVGRQ